MQKNHGDAKKIKFIPMLSQLEEAAKNLPDPVAAGADSMDVELEGTGRKISFERIEVFRGDGSKTFKWTYKGRIFINSRFLKNEK